MVGWVNPDGQLTITDRFIFTRKQDGSGVRLDLQQDWVAVGGEESVNGSTGETWTTIHFWRYLDTGDANDRPIPNGRLAQIVWSYGRQEALSLSQCESLSVGTLEDISCLPSNSRCSLVVHSRLHMNGD